VHLAYGENDTSMVLTFASVQGDRATVTVTPNNGGKSSGLSYTFAINWSLPTAVVTGPGSGTTVLPVKFNLLMKYCLK
jgi:hypothetical protein